MGGEQAECPLDLGIQTAAALEGQAHGLAATVAYAGGVVPYSKPGATSLSQVPPRSGLKVLCDPQALR